MGGTCWDYANGQKWANELKIWSPGVGMTIIVKEVYGIHVYPRSQVSIYWTIGPQVLYLG